MTAARRARDAVQGRNLGCCDLCGQHLGTSWAAHHRLPRSGGGTWALSNVTALHTECHQHVHSHPAESYASGHLVRRGHDPAEVPVHLAVAWAQPQPMLLDDDGTMRAVDR